MWLNLNSFFSFSIVLAELLLLEIEIKKLNVQMIAYDFNGFSNLCFSNPLSVFLSFSASLVHSYDLF